MALSDGWPAQSGVADQIEIRKNLAGLIVRDTSGNPRAGVFPRHTNALVTSTASMNVAVAPFEAAAVRAGGPVFLSNDGSVNVPISTAPVANSRYTVVWVRQKENGYGGLADGSNGAEFGTTDGTASAAPDPATVLAAIPAGAIPLATVLVPSTATATNSGGVVITQVFPYTTTAGGTLLFRNATERDAAGAFVAHTRCVLLDTGIQYTYSATAGAWRKPGLLASGTVTAASSITIDGLSGFSEYEVILDLPSSSAANTIAAQLRSGGSTDSSSNYDLQRDTGADSATAASPTYGSNSWAALTVSDRSDKLIRLKITGLNEARRTMVQAEVNAFNATNNGITNRLALRHRSTSAFNGIIFTVSSGTVTGTYEVYAR